MPLYACVYARAYVRARKRTRVLVCVWVGARARVCVCSARSFVRIRAKEDWLHLNRNTASSAQQSRDNLYLTSPAIM